MQSVAACYIKMTFTTKGQDRSYLAVTLAMLAQLSLRSESPVPDLSAASYQLTYTCQGTCVNPKPEGIISLDQAKLRKDIRARLERTQAYPGKLIMSWGQSNMTTQMACSSCLQAAQVQHPHAHLRHSLLPLTLLSSHSKQWCVQFSICRGYCRAPKPTKAQHTYWMAR